MGKNVYRLLSLAVALGLVAASLSGCSVKGVGPVARAAELKSGKARLAAPSPGEAAVSDLVAGNTRFALGLYGVLFDKSANLFYSPYSISLALAMTYAGARGNTEQEMAQALAFTLPQDRLHPAFNSLDQALSSRGEKAQQEGERFRLHVANSLWGQQGFSFQPAFLDLLAQHYGAGMQVLDFESAPEPSRQTINRWVEEQTEQKIKDLLPAGSVDRLTRLVLTNAIYFNAGWKDPFEAEATQDGAFHLLNGSTATVPMMQESESLGYGEGEGCQVVELPYVGDEMSMVILLPAEGRFEEFARGLDAGRLAGALQGIGPAQVQLTLPKFKYESSVALKDALAKLGMAEAFEDRADLSGMTGRRDLYISDVYHKAFVAVDEKGTEAAAATAVVMQVTAMPAEAKEVRVDRPFIFLIRDMQTGAILFLGHVVNPAA